MVRYWIGFAVGARCCDDLPPPRPWMPLQGALNRFFAQCISSLRSNYGESTPPFPAGRRRYLDTYPTSFVGGNWGCAWQRFARVLRVARRRFIAVTGSTATNSRKI